MQYKFTRDEIKAAMMISGYSAGEKLIKETLKQDLKHHYTEDVFDSFYEAMASSFPAMDKLKNIFKSIWDNNRELYTWTLPDGFQVQYRPIQTYNINIQPFGGALSIDMMATIAKSTTRNTGLAVNFIHSWDAYVCREVVRRCDFPVFTIHDGFKCHPNHIDAMNRTYVQILAEIADSRYLESCIEEIIGKPVADLNKEFSGSEVTMSKYALC